MIFLRIITVLLPFLFQSTATADPRDRESQVNERNSYYEDHDDGEMNLECRQCRDLSIYPEDGANFALNQVWGPSSWMTLSQADMFKIHDRFGNELTVDMNLKIDVAWIPKDFIATDRFRFQVPWPTDLLIQILIRNERWTLIYSDIIRPSEPDWPLLVGELANENAPTEAGPAEGTGEGASDGEDEDRDDSSGEEFGDDTGGDEWTEADLGGEECESCTAAFDADRDGELDRDRNGDLIEYEL